jgi:vacuolar-type H+-ATPase subunit I/STV1
MKGQKFLKVTSILMIIGGVLAAITGLLALLGISALAAMAGSAEGTGLLYASSALAIVSSIELIAGIKGVGACSAPQKAGSCVKWGIIIVALSIVSMVIGLIAGGSFSFTSLVLNLIVPGLYIYGAIQMKNA